MTAFIAFALGNWRWLIPSLIAAALAVTIGVQRLEISELKATAAKTELAIEKQKTEAATIIADARKHNADLAARAAELSAQLEKEHGDALADINARDRRHADLVATNGGLRISAASCGPRGSDRMPGAGAAAGVPAEPAGGVECRLSPDLSTAIRGDYRSSAIVTEFARRALEAAVACYGKAANP